MVNIKNYDVDENGEKGFVQRYDFMPDRSFRMLICAPSGGGKTNLLLDMIYRLLHFDKIYLYAKNLQQYKYQDLLQRFEPISEEVGYDIIEATNGDITPFG